LNGDPSSGRSIGTRGSYAAFQEVEGGSVTRGKLAELEVLSEDIMTVLAQRILDARVEITIVGADVVYEAPRGSDRTDR
jgi:predicted amidohydrolase YtcJ